MGARRALIDGIQPDPAVEKHFMRTGQIPDEKEAPLAADQPSPRDTEAPAAKAAGRAPLTTRIRADFAVALKRASLERQLNGIEPHTLQDILEEALEPWLRKNSYIQ